MTEVPGGDAAITVTLKAGPGYDAPWVVVRADNPAEAYQRLDGLGQTGLLAKAAEVAVELHGVFNAAAGLGAKPTSVEGNQPQSGWGSSRSTGQQQQAQQSDNGQAPAPHCAHGERVYKTGTGRNGKTWKAWMCNLPRGSDNACEPEWV